MDIIEYKWLNIFVYYCYIRNTSYIYAMLTEHEKKLYNRHLLIPGFTESDQEKLFKARVLVVGAGGIGSPVLLYLVAAGIRNVGIVETDTVALHNLPRQILFNYDEEEKPKGLVASKKLNLLNPESYVKWFDTWWSKDNAKSIAANYDLIVDCTDNIDARLTTNWVSKELNIPFVFGAISGWQGQVSVFNMGLDEKDYVEALNIPKDNNSEHKPVGVIGVSPAVIGSIMASETIKIIIDKGELLQGKLLHINLLTNEWNTFFFD